MFSRGRRVTRMVGHPNLIIDTMRDLAQENGWKFESNPNRLWGENEWNDIHMHLATPTFKSNFHVQQMPGCCAVLIASYLRVEPYTQKNVDELIQIIETAAYNAGFGSVLMAQVVDAAMKRVKAEPWGMALNRKWRITPGFMNAKSGNTVAFLFKDLEQKGKVPGLEIEL